MTRTLTSARCEPAAGACAATVLSLAACGRDDDGGESEEAESISEDASGTVEVWAMEAEGEALGPFVKDFEAEYPDIDVEVTPVPWASAHDKLSTAIASGKTPDVSLIGTTWMGEFAELGGLDPVPPDLVDDSSFFQGAYDSTVVNDTEYGVPWYVETRVLFYRKDLAKLAGWNSAPTSWEELVQFGDDLAAEANVETPLYVQPGQTGSWQTALPFAWTAGAETTNADGTEYTLDSDAMKQGLEYYKSLFDNGLSTTDILDPGELEPLFADGKIGSFISGPWEVTLVKDAGVTDKQLAVAPLPGQDSGMGTSFIGGGDLAVFKDSDNRDAAWTLVKWLSQPDVQSKWYETTSDLPAVKSSWDTGALADDPVLSVFGKQLDSGNSPPAVPTWEQVAEVIDRDIERVVRGEMSVDEAVGDMQSQASSIGTGL